MFSISLAAYSLGKLSGYASQSSKVKGVTNAKLRKVGINFCCVDGFASEGGVHFGGRNSLVVQIRVWADLKSMGVTSYRF